MTVREYAKLKGFEVVGKLKRLPDVYYGVGNKSHYPLWIDEAGNEYCGSALENIGQRDGRSADGGVI